MQIELHEIKPHSLEDFADKHGFIMVVTERVRPLRPSMRYYAAFKNVEMSSGTCLWSVRGNGATPDEAIQEYAAAISGQPLVRDAFSHSRYEVTAPKRLIYGKGQ